MHLFYLHGFASSASSSKARFFAERLAGLGHTLHCPDLNLPDFSTLTTTRMIGQVDAAIAGLPPGPVTLIGSSLGAFVAWHASARVVQPAHPIERLVLLAPAFDFGRVGVPGFGEQELEAWRTAGWREFFHHASQELRRVHIGLYDDAQHYLSSDVTTETPTLVFQGTRDELVDAERVRAFVSTRPSMTLVLFDDDHQLHASLETIWARTAAFLDLRTAQPAEG